MTLELCAGPTVSVQCQHQRPPAITGGLGFQDQSEPGHSTHTQKHKRRETGNQRLQDVLVSQGPTQVSGEVGAEGAAEKTVPGEGPSPGELAR